VLWVPVTALGSFVLARGWKLVSASGPVVSSFRPSLLVRRSLSKWGRLRLPWLAQGLGQQQSSACEPSSP